MSLLEKKLLETLVIDDATYRKANILTKKYGGTIPLNLVRMNAVIEDNLLDFIKNKFSIPSVGQEELQDIKIAVLNLIPGELAKRFRFIPFDFSEGEVKIIMSDPTDKKIIDEISYITGRSVTVFSSLESIISWALLKYYGVITESGSELGDIGDLGTSAASLEEEEIPIPLVTRKRESVPPTAKTKKQEPEKAAAAKVENQTMPEMGGWDSPFELSRPPSSSDDGSVPARDVIKKAAKRYRRKTPTKVAIPSPAAVEIDFGPQPETKPEEPPQPETVKKETAAKEAKKKEVVVDEHRERRATVRAYEKPVENIRPERESSVSIAPVYLIGSTSTVAETIKKQKKKKVAKVKKPVFEKSTFPPPPPTKGIPTKTIDRSRVDRWAAYINTLGDTEKIIERTLSFLDTVFGPTVFLRKKKDALEPYRFSLSVPKSMHDKLKKIIIKQEGFNQLWESLDGAKFSLGKISVNEEYRPILDINIDAGWDAKTLVLIIPVIIGKAKAGVLLSVPTSDWSDNQELQDIFSVIESTLSSVFEKIIIEKKKGKNGK